MSLSVVVTIKEHNRLGDINSSEKIESPGSRADRLIHSDERILLLLFAKRQRVRETDKQRREAQTETETKRQ